MHRFTSKVTLLTIPALALMVALMLVLGSFSSTDDAEAATPSYAGTFDLLVDVGVPIGTTGSGLYHCILNTDGASVSRLVCYADVELGDADGEPPALPGEGNNALEGPPPPPPYTTLPPVAVSGVTATGTPAGIAICFPDLGAGPAPNLMANLTSGGIGAGTSTGSTVLFNNMSDTRCASGSTTGATGSGALPIVIYRVADKAGVADAAGCAASWRSNAPAHGCLDYDADGCTDAAELTNTGAAACGDDPYNPLDGSVTDLDGAYSVSAIAQVPSGNGAGVLPDCPSPLTQCPWTATTATNPVPGITFHCIANVVDPAGATPRTVSQNLYCYIDSLASEINPEGYPSCTGDGLPGASPPGRIRNGFQTPATYKCGGATVWGDMSTIKHTELSGTVSGSGASTVLTTTGCFEDDDAQSSLGNVIVNSTQDAHTGNGTVDIWVSQSGAACTAANGGTVPGGAPTFNDALLRTARQSSNQSRDSDGDGCSDAHELNDGNDPAVGGLRDPFNRWDVYDPAPSNGNGDLDPGDGDGVVDLFNDIFGVAFLFGLVSTDAGYDEAMDRAAPIAGSNIWNLPNADGTIDLFNDIFGVAFQFGLDCTQAPA